MRQAFCGAMLAQYRRRPFVFATGDLGFKALEPLRDAMGEDFINAGVAEQNMISVAAGIAKTGLQVWAYSIAPFLYARPFEQIRNDICLHDLPVKLVGNGGGYGYGVMGATHHALEDYGVLLTLRGMNVYAPVFDEDIAPVIASVAQSAQPCYLRLGLDQKPKGFQPPDYAPWRIVAEGGRGVIIAIGAIASSLIAPLLELPEEKRPMLWALAELPVGVHLPMRLLDMLRAGQPLCVMEEHVEQGGAGQMLAAALLKAGVTPSRFVIAAAKGYISGRYGSQGFHRIESGLTLKAALEALG